MPPLPTLTDPPAVNPFITRSREARATARAALDALVARVDGEQRTNLTPDEQTEFDRLADEIRTLDGRVTELLDADEREAITARRSAAISGDEPGSLRVRSEPLTYQRENRSHSYFRDLGLAYVGGDQEARARLNAHGAEMRVEMPRREARIAAEFERRLSELRVGDREASFERRDITRVDGAGGEFVPPLWLLDEFAEFARAGRPFANVVRNIPLPPGTDSLNIPRITTGSQAQPQTADNAAVQETDIVTNSVAAPVRTIAGQQDIALQLLEQSPMMFDELVFADLTADYNARLDAQLLNGSGASGQIQGVLGLSGTNSVTYTDATPTVPELYPKGADALSQLATNRLRPGQIWLFAPRRWYWMTAALDSQNRPLVVPTAQNPYNALAGVSDVATEGPVGFWHGLPTLLDPNMPVNLGAGTNEDRIVATRPSDLVLFEGALRTRALPEVLSGNLTVRLQVYAYAAFTAGRFPASTSIVSGTGLITPTF